MKVDVAIIGAGPAGLSAGIFTSRAGLKTVCFEKLAIGGQASLSHSIENYPGFEKISGYELMETMYKHATSVGTEVVFSTVNKVCQTKTGFCLTTNAETYNAKKLIIATGGKPRKLGLEKEKAFIGKGVSYCASCDGDFFKNKTVAVVGGGNSAVEAVDYLSPIVKKVYVLNRSEKFKANQNDIERIKKYKNVHILTNSAVKDLFGKDVLSKTKVEINGETKNIKTDGLFVTIGREPDLSFLDFDLECDRYGFIIVDEKMKTNVKNCYACGDIVSKHFKQVVTACADGAIAGNACIGG
ncbi:MAG: FAD-dependent oxidoreductase [Clostridia bacterium]|nr:FAD-dependent oxidoreductase [Clostridia bacterium]